MKRVSVLALVTLFVIAGCGGSDDEPWNSESTAAKGEDREDVQNWEVIPALAPTKEVLGVARWTVYEMGTADSPIKNIEGHDATGNLLMRLEMHLGSQQVAFQPATGGFCELDEQGTAVGNSTPEVCKQMQIAQVLFAADVEGSLQNTIWQPICDTVREFKNLIHNTSVIGSGLSVAACGACAVSIASLWYGWWGPSWPYVYHTCAACALSVGITLPSLAALQSCL